MYTALNENIRINLYLYVYVHSHYVCGRIYTPARIYQTYQSYVWYWNSKQINNTHNTYLEVELSHEGCPGSEGSEERLTRPPLLCVAVIVRRAPAALVTAIAIYVSPGQPVEGLP